MGFYDPIGLIAAQNDLKMTKNSLKTAENIQEHGNDVKIVESDIDFAKNYVKTTERDIKYRKWSQNDQTVVRNTVNGVKTAEFNVRTIEMMFKLL